MTRLKDRIALVTGSSSGIGRAIAIALGAEGAALWLVGRHPETLEEVAKKTRGASASVIAFKADLTVQEEVRALADRIRSECGALDILVHGAGVHAFGRIESTPIEELDRQLIANVKAPFVLTQALLPLLRSRRGQIVFVNSSAGESARANVGAYAATKHALRALADSLRDEVNPEGVRVLSLFLGRTATPMQAAIHEVEGKPYRPDLLLQPEDVASMVVSALSLPRTAEVTEIRIRPMNKT